MRRSSTLISLTALAGSLLLAGSACAAELGDVAVRSYVGQPLSADIELVQIAADEAASLQVRLAQENVYRGANISMNPALATLHMTIVRRDGRQYVRVSTTRPIEADYLHLFLELSAAGRQEVRAATVWLQADPNAGLRAAASVAPAPAPLPPIASTSPAAPASAAEAVRPRAAPMPSLHESEVGAPGSLRASAAVAPARRPVSKPAAPKVAGESAAHGEAAMPVPVAQALLPMPALPLPAGVKRPAATCAPAAAGAAKECAALDAHNQALTSKLTELEGKVKVLQGALNTASAPAKIAAPEPAKAAASEPAQTKPASAAASAHASASHAASETGAAEAASSERWVPPPGVQGELAKARAAAAASGHEAASETAGESASESASASASASASESASAASGPVKKVKVLPKLKYKKEKPPEPAPSSNLPLIAGGAAVALLLLGGLGWLFWRKKRGAPPFNLGQLLRKKKAAEPEVKHEEAPPLSEVTPESLLEQST